MPLQPIRANFKFQLNLRESSAVGLNLQEARGNFDFYDTT
jgi:hypothetical protein